MKAPAISLESRVVLRQARPPLTPAERAFKDRMAQWVAQRLEERLNLELVALALGAPRLHLPRR